MIEFLSNRYFLIALTFVVYVMARKIYRMTGVALLNPILVSIAVIICFLCGNGISYDDYNAGGSYIDFWLKPAVVALGVPLYKQLSVIRKQLLPIFFAEVAGCVAGIISVVLLAEAFGASRQVALSLASKSVTTPIAMEVTESIGGIPALTAAVVVGVGIFGGLAGFKLMRLSHVNSPIASSLSMGTAAHAIGTSAAMDLGYRYGAFSSLGLTINGLLTALLAPTILRMFGYAL